MPDYVMGSKTSLYLGLSVGHYILNWREVSVPVFYGSTCSLPCFFFLIRETDSLSKSRFAAVRFRFAAVWSRFVAVRSRFVAELQVLSRFAAVQ